MSRVDGFLTDLTFSRLLDLIEGRWLPNGHRDCGLASDRVLGSLASTHLTLRIRHLAV